MPTFRTQTYTAAEIQVCTNVDILSSKTEILGTVLLSQVEKCPWGTFTIDVAVVSGSIGAGHPPLRFWLSPKASNGDFEVGTDAGKQPQREPDFVLSPSAEVTQRTAVPWQSLPGSDFRVICCNNSVATLRFSVRLTPVTEQQVPV